MGPDGLASAGKPLLIVDCSTSEPASTAAPRGSNSKRPGSRFVDAPLSRTPKDAWEGTLDVMVGGDPATSRARGRSSRPSPAASSRPGRSAPATR